MSSPENDLNDDLPDDDGAPVLASFAVTARVRVPSTDAEAADRAVRRQLADGQVPYDDLRVEPREPDGRWAVDVRVVVVSLDAATAVEGVHRTLVEAGVDVSEAWMSERLP